MAQQLNTQNNGEVFMFILDGNLEAGLILIDEIWKQLAEHLKDEIVVCVPPQDVLVATTKSNEAMIEAFTIKARDVLVSGDHPLSKYWYIRQGNDWVAFRQIIA